MPIVCQCCAKCEDRERTDVFSAIKELSGKWKRLTIRWYLHKML